MREYLEAYGQVSVSLERMSDYTKKLLERAKAAEAESKENYYTMIEFRKAADMNCKRYLKLKKLLTEVATSANGMCGLDVDVELLTRIQELLGADAK